MFTNCNTVEQHFEKFAFYEGKTSRARPELRSPATGFSSYRSRNPIMLDACLGENGGEDQKKEIKTCIDKEKEVRRVIWDSLCPLSYVFQFEINF